MSLQLIDHQGVVGSMVATRGCAGRHVGKHGRECKLGMSLYQFLCILRAFQIIWHININEAYQPHDSGIHS